MTRHLRSFLRRHYTEQPEGNLETAWRNVGSFLRVGEGFFAERTTSISRRFAACFRCFLREGIFLYRDVRKTVRKTSQEIVIIVHGGLTVYERPKVSNERQLMTCNCQVKSEIEMLN